MEENQTQQLLRVPSVWSSQRNLFFLNKLLLICYSNQTGVVLDGASCVYNNYICFSTKLPFTTWHSPSYKEATLTAALLFQDFLKLSQITHKNENNIHNINIALCAVSLCNAVEMHPTSCHYYWPQYMAARGQCYWPVDGSTRLARPDSWESKFTCLSCHGLSALTSHFVP